MESRPKVFASVYDSILILLSVIVLNYEEKIVKRAYAYAKFERKCSSSAFTCTLPTMPITMD